MAGAHTVFAVTSGLALLEAETPQSYREAMSSKEKDKWMVAMKSEFDGCVAQGTWLKFHATASDPCVFWRKSATGRMILLFLFVDDMQVAFDKHDEDEWNEAHRALKDRFNITDLGESKYMLGMKITRDRQFRTIKLDQELYITKSLEKFGLDKCKPAKTPAVQSSMNKLTQHMLNPTEVHARAADRVFRYLAGTKLNGLLFGRRPKSSESTGTAAASTQELTKNGIKSERTKHIDIKYRFVTDEVAKGKIELKWIPTTQQLADVLTKSLGSPQHNALVEKLMVVDDCNDHHPAQDKKKEDG
ncbi:Reverse transcriptase, RNA-dependent DNA polymerase [Corchorus olitorius]|uniref:Reverse transcriptase, RNA-dependent DNA polymerase n=1 Tax=Corchorus olitorius TaxID=93759 RepID=A0A1R3KU18_9ROSI|nr:Reverse transcriptase, RNA-dependent DNA polymerase [Corchorus olitorius]